MSADPIKEIAQNMRTQDNAATQHPLFVVFDKQRIYADRYDECDGFAWFRPTDDGPIEADEQETRDLEDEVEFDGYERFYRLEYVTVRKFVTACFTRNGAQDYIAANRHHMQDPFIYVESLARNAEMITVREHLLGVTP